MLIKINDSVASVTWSLQRGQIVDANNYPDALRWIANGTATVVEPEIETASLETPELETAAPKKIYASKRK